ncbi:MAG: LamG domain-containing protein [Planctomycetota bacterium]
MCKRMTYVVVVMMLALAPMNLVCAASPDLLAWWPCDEGAGTVVGDISGNGHDGTFVNGGPSWGPGIHGNAVQLVGPTLIEVPALNVVLTEATMAGWIKPNGSQPDWSSFIMTRDPGLATGFNVLGYQLAYHWNDTENSWSYRGGDMIAADDWTFAAVTIEPDKATFYVNGVPGSVNMVTHGPCTWNSNIYLGGDGGAGWVARRMNGALDDVSFFSRALTAAEILDIMQGLGAYPTASNPNPANGALHADTWVNLSWKAGDFAVSHDVYLGDSFEDVDAGTGDTFRGNQTSTFYVAGFPGFAYPDGLVPGTTYYWRIDEVNDAEPNSPWKGDVWSFSIPPKTAYNPRPADGAEGVALDAKLTWTAGFGAKLHTVYFGTDFDSVSNAAGGLPQGTTTYNPGPLQDEKVYYWRVDEFDALATYKGDVWGFTTPGAAGNPQPSNRATGVAMTAKLGWTPATTAVSHDVYFGTDKDAVKNATTASPEYKGNKALGSESYDPGKLAWNSDYYWRVDAVYTGGPVKGLLWSLTTADFIAVDDFESYNDIEPPDPASNRIFDNWIDGFGTTNNGALVGNDMPPYAEQTVVHGGIQSMPYAYDNNLKTSEATLTLTAPRNWTRHELGELSIWFRGYPPSVGGFTEAPAGTYTMTAAGTDISGTADQFHFAYKMLTGAGSIVARVDSVQNTNAWAKAGVMIRETLDAGSKHAFACVTPGNGVASQGRTAADAASFNTNQTGITAPRWVKLERDAGGNFTVSHSANGTTWEPVANAIPTNVSMTSNVYVGLALTSHAAAQTCEAKFSNVTITGTVSAQWAHQDVGILTNAAEPLYVALANKTGTPVVVYQDDANAATIDTWTEWVIPLQKFADQGVNLADVDKIAIGLGAQGNMTTPGGSGTLFIDDVRLYRPRAASAQ